MLDFTDALYGAIRSTEEGIDSLGQVLNGILVENQPFEKAQDATVASSTEPPARRPVRVEQGWDQTMTSLVQERGPDRAQQRDSAVRQSIADLMTQGGFEDPSAPTANEGLRGGGGPVMVNTEPFRRYAFGGGDLGSIGVTPAERTGFFETKRRRYGLAPNQRVRADGSVETHYIAANALQAIMKLVDESVARQLGSMGVR